MTDLSRNRPFELAVEPRNEEYDRDDEGWRDQVVTLYADLHTNVDVVSRGCPVEGDAAKKGGLDQLIIALGSAGAFSAVVDCFRAWLGRDRDRRIDIRWDDENGVERSATLTGEAIDVETLRDVARAAIARVGGPAWPAGTLPS
jgi:Effector Associated Constant Component 1